MDLPDKFISWPLPRLLPSRITRANPVHPPPCLTTDTDSAEPDTILLDQVTRDKPHTYLCRPQLLPVPHVLSSWRFTPLIYWREFLLVQTK
ncbi:hypothetical protein AMECASPLE_015769 [Ameca splendens]|uniref:Uncharacterized protein n=1 Tax=Ameca splendens TaxID=208324 RepID=A0ABV0Z066_9TELE